MKSLYNHTIIEQTSKAFIIFPCQIYLKSNLSKLSTASNIHYTALKFGLTNHLYKYISLAFKTLQTHFQHTTVKTKECNTCASLQAVKSESTIRGHLLNYPPWVHRGMTKHRVIMICTTMITAIKNVFCLYWTQLVYRKDNAVWYVQCRIGRFWHAHRVITRTSHCVTNRSDRQVYVR